MTEQYKIPNAEHLIEETIKRYNEIAEDYSSGWRGQLDATESAKSTKFEKLIGTPPRKILDVGCGTGKHSICFARRGFDVYGIDRSLGMLKEAIQNSIGLQINFTMEDMRSISFPNDFFDGIWTVAAIAHLPPTDKQKFIQEAYRVLRPNGILYIGAHNLLSRKHITRLIRCYLSYLLHSDDCFNAKLKTVATWMKTGYLFLDNRHWFYPWKGSLLKMLRETGFIVLESSSCFSKRLSIYARKVETDPKGG